MNKNISVSAPGKIILFGEHAVVYDKLGIVYSIDKRCYVRLITNAEGCFFINSDRFGRQGPFSEKEISDLYNLQKKLIEDNNFKGLQELYKKNRLNPILFVMGSIFNKYGFCGCDVYIKSDVPKGLGSSSALFSALSFALLKQFKQKVSRDEVSSLAYQGDIVAHGGTPSGIDNNAVTHGGCLTYRQSQGVKVLKSQPNILRLVVVDTGEEPRTAETVAQVRQLREETPLLVNPILDRLNFFSEEALRELENKPDIQKVGRLMNNYYLELKKLDISTPRIDQVMGLALENNALGAKPTGGWGGGCCLVLAEDQPKRDALQKVFRSRGFPCFEIKTGGSGVMEA
ncbi:MAG: mevalonate kinase [Candidatus Nealsonbacteria bacterium]|nr:mevalonate kinase [Candidatus Nealsonbacteria bacterium]